MCYNPMLHVQKHDLQMTMGSLTSMDNEPKDDEHQMKNR